MPIDPKLLNAAKSVQNGAAHDASPQVRLVAGPGTGKSFSISERISWIVAQGFAPEGVWAISFTNAATNDLRAGIMNKCASVPGIERVRISTLHSLALTILAKGNRLTAFPARPRVLDGWEERYVFDEEFASSRASNITRSKELRVHFEAMWSTSMPPAAFMSSPKSPISPGEEALFVAYYRQTTQLYSCLLPGEAVRRCVDDIKAGTLSPVQLTGLTHLIVDEYQDLNPADIELIDLLAAAGVVLFACGDDDQSIYSFRYAFPGGIQGFTARHPSAGSHNLDHCFRCATAVLDQAKALISSFPPTSRLPKNLTSVYASSTPPIAGQALAWAFSTAYAEAEAIASSIKQLIQAGMPAEEILILISSRDAQLQILTEALSRNAVPSDPQADIGIASEDGVRFVYSVLRAIADGDDYVALRVLLGMRKGVGVGTCASIASTCLTNHLNFQDQVRGRRSATAFKARESKALDGVAEILAAIAGWSLDDSLSMRKGDLAALALSHLDARARSQWTDLADQLPDDMSLAEVLGFLASRTAREARTLLQDVHARIGIPLPASLDPTGRVRIMTLHSCKGLTAQVVFLPGLEEEILPGRRRALYPAQVEEAARLLYVGLTRARVANICSFAQRRLMNGQPTPHTASRFLAALGVVFRSSTGMTTAEISAAVADWQNL